MGFWDLLLMAVALSMDACALAMTDGMTNAKMPFKKALLVGLFFGFFQFLMPVIGYFITGVIADAFLDTFESISAWVSFGLLAFLGGKMLVDGIKEWREAKTHKDAFCEVNAGAEACAACQKPEALTLGKLFLQAIATSIDALAVGVTLQMAALSESGLALGVWGATGLIGVTTLLLSVGAVYIGKFVGNKLADKATLLGGVVLVGIGVKILLEAIL